MTEHLYYLLTVEHFFNKAIDLAQIVLLFSEIFTGFSGYLLCDNKHYDRHTYGKYRHRYAHNKHRNKRDYNCSTAVYHLRYTLRDKLSECINIICVNRHYIAVLVCVKILYRELFHIGEKVVTEVSERTLSYVYHYPVIRIRCRQTDNINYRKSEHCKRKRCKICAFSRNHRLDIIVYKRLYEQHSEKRCDRLHKNTHNNADTREFITAECVFNNSAEQFYLFLR